MNMLTYTKVNNISIYLYIFKFLLIIYLCIECWQDDPENRPNIQDVEKSLISMISGSNIVNNDRQQKNGENISFGHSNPILTEYTNIDLMEDVLINERDDLELKESDILEYLNGKDIIQLNQ